MSTTEQPAPIVHLRGGSTSFIVEISAPVPRVLHWGADLGELSAAELDTVRVTAVPSVTHNSTDTPRRLSVLPTEADAWSGTPGIEGRLRSTGMPYPRFDLVGHTVEEDGSALVIALRSGEFGLTVHLRYALDEHGILATSADVTRMNVDDQQAADVFDLSALTIILPLPERAVELVDFTGKWSRERSPQRTDIPFGTHLRESRRGRPSLDSPYLLLAGTRSFGFRTGEVWGLHVGWSGNQRYYVEQPPEGAGAHRAVLGGGELLLPGEVALGAGDSYRTPTLYFAWSDQGMDGVAGRFHDMLRSRPQHPAGPRPLVLNTWEAVYFNHDLETLIDLVDRAATVGVERIVLDDGWFLGRRSDRTGLGDWFVDPEVWPQGLSPFVERVRSHGMQFGLWFEPEMINLSSRLAQEHPSWVLAPAAGAGPAFRHQHVLNIADEDAWQFLFDRIDALVSEYAIDYIKWDHNRELHEAGRRDAGGRAGVRAQTEALYRLLDALRTKHRGLEIESCASGGGRIDLGILQRTDRVWASDCNDPVERQQIQRWTGQLVPPELIGTHLGAAEAHTTNRVTSLSFRLATALFGHAGIEQGLTACDDDELGTIRAWADLYKELRPLLHSGRVVRADVADEQTLLHGVVSQDRREAVFSWARLGTSPAIQAGRVPLPGLDPGRSYRLRLRTEIGAPVLHEYAPEWLAAAERGTVTLSGHVLARLGLLMPTLQPQQAIVLQLDAA
ncbi:alpha-galactosidase [Nonomuraea sp. NEAU-A123]|uniref:alpha-galactosidase n=1 Tax=Nonomuraea sp. NEAU-A123 TaxID=2839649 RepID=UPI001BE48911|nr:alpha-galactosidase [Nonomuraea sp. NEAU-A123]MBT2231932.1 alpha-galactosidase [Nonomuraea sp. NEAU-A123]